MIVPAYVIFQFWPRHCLTSHIILFTPFLVNDEDNKVAECVETKFKFIPSMKLEWTTFCCFDASTRTEFV